MADLESQLKIQLEINAALKEREAIMSRLGNLNTNQGAIAEKIKKSADCKPLKDMENCAKTMGQTMADEADRAGNGLNDLSDKAETLEERMERLEKRAIAMSILTGAVRGLGAGFRFTTNMVKGFFKGIKGVAGALFKLGKTIIALPFRIFQGFLDMAQGSGGVSPFRQALEELRKEMGDFRTGPAKQVVGGLANMRKEFGHGFFKAGSFAKVFGYGREGMAAALKFSMEMMKGIGPIVHTMGEEFKQNAGKLAKFQKGLGMSSEAMGHIVASAKASGKDYLKTFTEIEKYSDHMEDAFGISKKVIAKEVGEMAMSMKHFSDLTEKEMVETVVQTKRLGISMKALQGIIDGFDNFEKAAENAALLRRQFGMIVDAEKLMFAKGPEKIKMLQDALKKTGKSFESMGRIEKQIFADRVGMDLKEAKMAFGKKSMQKDFNKVKKEGDKAQKKTLSTAQALARLGKQIERVFGSGGKKYKGFFHAFIDGFGRGVYWSKEFYTAMRRVRMSLHVVRYSGMQVGRAFVKYFPGVKKMLAAISDFFDPRNVHKNMNGVTKAFTKFFKTVGKPGNARKALDTFLDEMQEILSTFFGGKGGAAKSFMKGFDTFATILGNLKIMMLEKAVLGATSFIHKFSDVLIEILYGGGNPLAGAGDAAAAGFTGRFGESLNKLFMTLRDKLYPALVHLMPLLFEAFLKGMSMMREFVLKHKNKIIKFIGDGIALIMGMKIEIMKYMFENHKMALALMLAPMLAGPLIMATSAAIKAGLGAIGAKFAAGGGALAGAGVVAKGLLLGIGKMALGVTKRIPMIAAVYSIGKGLIQGVKESMAADNETSWKSVGMGLAGVAAGIFEGATLGLLDADKTMDTWFGGFRYADKLAAEQAEEAAKASKIFDETADSILESFRRRNKKLKQGSFEQQKSFYQLAAFESPDGKKLESSSVGILHALAGNEKAAQKALDDAMAKVEKLKKQGSMYAGALGKWKAAHKDAKGFIADSNAEIAFSAAEREAGMQTAVGRALMYEFGSKYITSENGVITIDDDLYQQEGMAEKITKIMEGVANPEKFKKDAEMIMKAAREKNTELLNSVSEEGIRGAYVDAKLKGATGAGLDNLKAKLDQKIRDRMEQKLMKMMEKEGLGSISQSGHFIDKKTGEAITAANDPKFAGQLEALIEKEQKKLEGLLKPPVTEAQKHAKKLSELETAARTVTKMKELEGVPTALKALRTKFEKVDTEALKTNVKEVFQKVSDMTGFITDEIKTKELDKAKSGISPMVVSNLGSIKTIRDTVDAVMGKKTVSISTLAAREKNISSAITKMSDVMKTARESEGLKKGIPPTVLGNISVLKTSLTDIAGKNGALSVVPSNLNKKIKAAKDAITEVSAMMKEISSNKDLKLAVNLGQKLSAGDDISIEVKRARIQVSLQVNLNAKEFAKRLMQVDLQDGAGVNRLATIKDINK